MQLSDLDGLIAFIIILIYPPHHLTRLSVTMHPIRLSSPSHSLHICPSSRHFHSDGLPVIRYKSQPVTARFLHTVSPKILHFSSSSPRGIISLILFSRVSAERGQSAQLVLCGDGQQSGAFPVLPLPTQFPPSDSQGESRHEGVWQSCVACILWTPPKHCPTKEQVAHFFPKVAIWSETFQFLSPKFHMNQVCEIKLFPQKKKKIPESFWAGS